MRKIALLTSGGDSPGMNAAIRAIVKNCLYHGVTPIGICDGFKGLMAGNFSELTYESVNNIVHTGGTILGTARSEAFKVAEQRKGAIQKLQQENVEGLIVIGGDGSFTGATILSDEMQIPIIGIPGTIDNDIYGTDHTIGYDTALNTVVDAVDRLRDTASSHQRIFFVEVMGRHAGFIALNSALAAGAEMALIPEEKTNVAEVAKTIVAQNKGKRSSIIIVAEGDDAGGSSDIVRKIQPYLDGYDIRSTILGHIQRGGKPSAFDRILATRLGAEAVELLLNGATKLMVGVKGDKLVKVPLSDAIKCPITPDLTKSELLTKMLTR